MLHTHLYVFMPYSIYRIDVESRERELFVWYSTSIDHIWLSVCMYIAFSTVNNEFYIYVWYNSIHARVIPLCLCVRGLIGIHICIYTYLNIWWGRAIASLYACVWVCACTEWRAGYIIWISSMKPNVYSSYTHKYKRTQTLNIETKWVKRVRQYIYCADVLYEYNHYICCFNNRGIYIYWERARKRESESLK